MAALHGIDHQQQVSFITERPEPEQVFRAGWRDAPFALDALDQHGCGGGSEGGPHGLQIVERHMPEARGHRLKALLHLVLTGGGDAGQGPAMEGVEGGDDLEPALVVAEFPGQLVEPLVGFGAAVAKEHLARGEVTDQLPGQPALRFMVVEVRDVGQLFRLLDQLGSAPDGHDRGS